jgi:hypothetical protein
VLARQFSHLPQEGLTARRASTSTRDSWHKPCCPRPGRPASTSQTSASAVIVEVLHHQARAPDAVEEL